MDADFGSTARLKYRVYFTSSGQFTGTFYRVPTLNEGTEDSGTPRSTRIGDRARRDAARVRDAARLRADELRQRLGSTT